MTGSSGGALPMQADAARPESHTAQTAGQRVAEALAGTLGGADIGADRDVHADVAGGTRQDRADQEADTDLPAQGEDEDQEDAGDELAEVGVGVAHTRGFSLKREFTSPIQLLAS